MTTEYLYRFESHNSSLGVDQFDDPIPGHSVVLHLYKHEVLKWTPKGAWISKWNFGDEKKFVLLTARKQFASKTVKEAKQQFIHRKHKYISILQSKIDDTVSALHKIARYKT